MSSSGNNDGPVKIYHYCCENFLNFILHTLPRMLSWVWGFERSNDFLGILHAYCHIETPRWHLLIATPMCFLYDLNQLFYAFIHWAPTPSPMQPQTHSCLNSTNGFCVITWLSELNKNTQTKNQSLNWGWTFKHFGKHYTPSKPCLAI